MRLAVADGTALALAQGRRIDAPWLSMLGRVSDDELRALLRERGGVRVLRALEKAT